MTTTELHPPAHPASDREIALANAGRDDLFTYIHKALRKGLFDAAVLAGATDWTDAGEVTRFEACWQPLLALLRGHTRHEDDFIVRALESYEPAEYARVADEHCDLDDLLDHVAEAFDGAAASGDMVDGLLAYRDLNRFLAAYLPHLHEEETRIMPKLWEHCTDDQLAATRHAFMATLTPEEASLSLTLMLPALDGATRDRLLAGLAEHP
jgi:hypothetical protein